MHQSVLIDIIAEKIKQHNWFSLFFLLFSFFSYSSDRSEELPHLNHGSSSNNVSNGVIADLSNGLESVCFESEGEADGSYQESLQADMGSPNNSQTDSSFECPVCLCEFQLENMADLDCCIICQQCLCAYIENADRQTVKDLSLPCPSCEEAVDLWLIQRQMGEEQYERITRIISSIISSSQNSFQCPNCQEVMEVDKVNTQIKGNCVRCRATLCLFCRASPYHESITCEEYQKQQENTETNELPEGVFPCPSCSTLIQLASGCNHVICISCKKDVCAQCKKLMPEGYSHFGIGRCQLHTGKVEVEVEAITMTEAVAWAVDMAMVTTVMAKAESIIESQEIQKCLSKCIRRVRPPISGQRGQHAEPLCELCNNRSVASDHSSYCVECNNFIFAQTESDVLEGATAARVQAEAADRLQPSSEQRGQHAEPLCELCNNRPVASDHSSYCVECNNFIFAQTESDVLEGATAAGVQAEAADRLQPPSCQLCSQTIHQDGDYCENCQKIMESSLTGLGLDGAVGGATASGFQVEMSGSLSPFFCQLCNEATRQNDGYCESCQKILDCSMQRY